MSHSAFRGVAGAAHVLALFDATPATLNAARRAALVARDLHVPLRLLHARARMAAPKQPDRLAEFIRDADERWKVEVDAVPARGDLAAQCVPLARDGLVVLPTSRGNPLCESLMGGPAERLIRLVRAPVLVVKQPAQAAYRRVLVAVDLQPSSGALLAQAAAVARGAAVTAFHALTPAEELVLRELDSPAEALRAHRRMRANWASTRIERLQGGNPVAPIVAFGGAAESILAGETGGRSELIVIGKRRRGLLRDFLLGSVTRQVLARSEADVLVVPLAPAPQRAGEAGPANASLQG